ncbi:hypothetical protein TNCT_477581 [Trichonephila clavata]|uniref:Uncharacterized protein n=1 Tax=Trichonephila clavata TaxID=2740835 RepID=A0A8X6JJN4_TRICU|nr:hypothetical protein TNCT_477581 [Trichonephila clavata]
MRVDRLGDVTSSFISIRSECPDVLNQEVAPRVLFRVKEISWDLYVNPCVSAWLVLRTNDILIGGSLQTKAINRLGWRSDISFPPEENFRMYTRKFFCALF